MAHDLDTVEGRLAALLENVGSSGACRGCQAPVLWVKHANGKATPYDADGRNHFITCPVRDRFRKTFKP